jgi:hypothetical protein
MLAEMSGRELDGIRSHLETTGRTGTLRFRITRAVQVEGTGSYGDVTPWFLSSASTVIQCSARAPTYSPGTSRSLAQSIPAAT